MAGNSGRIAEIDCLRFVAALMVVCYHRLPFQLIGVPARDVVQHGFLGVELFFMISGFVILWTASRKNALQFAVSRVARLYPSFIIAVALTTVFLALAGQRVSAFRELANLTMLPSAFHQPMVDGVYWTLMVEIKFYVLVFLLICAGQMPRIEWCIGGWLALSLVATMAISLDYLTLSGYSSYFIAGCYLYLIQSRGPTIGRIIPLPICLALGVYNAQFIHHGFPSDTWSVASCIPLLVIEYAIFAALVFGLWRLPRSSLWGWLGALTYPLYLLHDVISNALIEMLPSTWSLGWKTADSLIAVLCLAAALALIIEKRVCPTLQRSLLAAVSRFRESGSTAVPSVVRSS